MISYGAGVYGRGVFGSGSSPLAPGFGVSPLSGNLVELALDPATQDIAFPPRWVRGQDAITQRLRARLRFFAGEWFLDTRLGVPYFDLVLIKNPRLPIINAIISKVLRTTPGVASVDSVSVAIVDRAKRVGAVNFNATLDDGLVLTAADEPFIIASPGGA